MFNTRDDMLTLVSKHGVFAEIGVFQGKFANTITKVLEPKQLILIDLFEGIMGSGDQDGNNFEFCNLEDVYTHLCRVSLQYPALKVMKGDSVTMLSQFPDNTFDMIYIDGDHSYEGCKRDLNIAFNKIKHAGWVMGHDYEMNMKKAQILYDFGVKQAVDEFCLDNNQVIYAKALDGCVSYAIQIQKNNDSHDALCPI